MATTGQWLDVGWQLDVICRLHGGLRIFFTIKPKIMSFFSFIYKINYLVGTWGRGYVWILAGYGMSYRLVGGGKQV